MYFKDFVNKYNGKKVDFDGVYGAQCVDLFRKFNAEVIGIAQPKPGNAKDFWSNYPSDPNLHNNFDRLANTKTFVPQEGDVAIWGAYGKNPYGHIAVCNGFGDVNNFESFDQNYPTNSACRIIKHNYFANFLGVLRPKNQGAIHAPSTFWCRVDKSCGAYVRKEANTSSALAGSKTLNKGDKFECTAIVDGQNVSGNNKWYRSKKGNFVWSGGITKI